MMPKDRQHIFLPCHHFWFNFDLLPLHKTVFEACNLLNSTMFCCVWNTRPAIIKLRKVTFCFHHCQPDLECHFSATIQQFQTIEVYFSMFSGL
jgi:hypothetical protein